MSGELHVVLGIREFGKITGKIMSQGRNGHVAVVARLDSLADGPARLRDRLLSGKDLAVRRNQVIGLGIGQCFECLKQGLPCTKKAVIVAHRFLPRPVAVLQAVQIPNAAFVIQRVSREDGRNSVDLHEITHRPVGMTGRR